MKWLGGIIDLMDMSLSKLRDREGQGSLACCSPWGHKESDTTERLNNKKMPFFRKALYLGVSHIGKALIFLFLPTA